MKFITGLYRHYRGGYYHAFTIAKNTENLEEYIVYRALDKEYGVWVRPRKDFEATLGPTRGKRFTFCHSLDDLAPTHINKPKQNFGVGWEDKYLF